MVIKFKNELLAINILTVLLIVIITFFPSGILHIILGLPVALFLPGYALLAALFPKKGTLNSLERAALSFGLSIPVVAFIGLILNYTPWGIRPTPVLYSVACFIFIASAIAWIQRRNLAVEERFSIEFRLTPPAWGEGNWNKALYSSLIIAILGTIGTLGYVIATPEVGERFTQFYILGLEGETEDYPKELAVGEEARVLVRIINQEREVISYLVEVIVDGVVNKEIGPVVLAHQEKWEKEIIFTLVKAGGNQKVELVLYKYEENKPYLRLHLLIDVTE